MIGFSHFSHDFSHRFPLEFQFVTVVQQLVKNGICQGGVTDGFVLLRNRQLACDQRGFQTMAILHDLQQVVALTEGHLLQFPVIK